MIPNLKRVSTAGMPREEWLALRKKSIGGSDAAALLGLSPFASKYSVWAEKRGILPEDPELEESEAVRQGRELEDYVAKRWQEATGKKCHRVNAMLYNPDLPFAHANVDRMVVGEDAGLECKTTTRLNLRKFEQGEFPAHYYVQCVHYMLVTGASRWYLAVLVLGKGFYVYTIERDDAEIEALRQVEETFWNRHIVPGIQPEVDGTEHTDKAIQAAFPGGGAPIELFSADSAIAAYLAAKELEKEAKRRADAAKQQIMAEMGNAEQATAAGGKYRIKWSRSVTRTFDHKAFAAAVGDAVPLDGFYKESPTNRFTIKEVENDD